MLDAKERFLVALWLRRYVTWCARCRREPQADGGGGAVAALAHSVADAGIAC